MKSRSEILVQVVAVVVVVVAGSAGAAAAAAAAVTTVAGGRIHNPIAQIGGGSIGGRHGDTHTDFY